MNIEPTSILAFRNGSIGNTLVAVPALRALRKRYPHATLSVVVDRTGYELLEHCPWIDKLIVYDKHGRDRSFRANFRLVRELRRLRPSHAILFKRFFRNGLLAYLSGASVRIGFSTDGRAPFLNRTVPYDSDVHIVDLNMQLAALLDASSAERAPALYLTEEDRARARSVGGSGRYLVAHYGGTSTSPGFLPAERFLALLQALTTDVTRVLFVGSGPEESSIAAGLASRISGARVTSNLPVRVTAAIIESAQLFVGFNSGPAHIAAAVHTPAVVFYRPGLQVQQEIQKWAPVSTSCCPFAPPHPSDSEGWAQFHERVIAAAAQLIDPPVAASGGRNT